jgi:[ribosomal protein S18]-alanine N-acetyltransferase
MIREFQAADVESLQGLLSTVPEATQWSADDFLLASQRNCLVRVAEEGRRVCGLVAFRMMADEAEILNLAVDSRVRRRGMGSRLIEDAMAMLKAAGITKIFLEVRESNEAARSFYARMGFTEAGRRRDYYREPAEDAFVLVRTVE